MKKNQWLCGRLIQINPLKRQVNLTKTMESFDFGRSRYIITKLLKGGQVKITAKNVSFKKDGIM